jgi:tetratricopeptide (TPR) repeat protein
LQAHREEFWSFTGGALAYRAGKFQDAVPIFEKSLAADARPGAAVLNWLWLSMANERLGKTDEARRGLSQAQVWLDQFKAGRPADGERKLGLDLHNWLEANVLRREGQRGLGLLQRL